MVLTFNFEERAERFTAVRRVKFKREPQLRPLMIITKMENTYLKRYVGCV